MTTLASLSDAQVVVLGECLRYRHVVTPRSSRTVEALQRRGLVIVSGYWAEVSPGAVVRISVSGRELMRAVMSAELARLRRVLEAATDGPWQADRAERYPAAVLDEVGDDMPRSDEDARAIAALGTLWPEMLAALDAAKDLDVEIDANLHRGGDMLRVPSVESSALRDALVDLDAAILEHLGSES